MLGAAVFRSIGKKPMFLESAIPTPRWHPKQQEFYTEGDGFRGRPLDFFERLGLGAGLARGQNQHHLFHAGAVHF